MVPTALAAGLDNRPSGNRAWENRITPTAE
jgi:hypothetical protein